MIQLSLLFVPRGFHSKDGSRPYPIKLKALLGKQNETQSTEPESKCMQNRRVSEYMRTNGIGGVIRPVESKNFDGVCCVVFIKEKQEPLSLTTRDTECS